MSWANALPVRLIAAVPALAQPTIVVNRFDAAGEIADWRFDFGGVAQTKSFSTDNAGGGGPTSGSMEVAMTFPATNGDHKGAYTNDEFFPGRNLAGYMPLPESPLIGRPGLGSRAGQLRPIALALARG